ncbi:MAG: molybdopterin dinucleotide binding domain-containing protein [Granulosicoccaceae bacterium]
MPRFEAVQQDLPFVLITPSSKDRTNATFGHCGASTGVEQLEMHPQDAQELGFEDGALVMVHNRRAEVQFQLKLSEAMQRGVLYSPKGTWQHSSSTGFTANALIPADIRTDIGSGACYNETYVSVSLQGEAA